MTNKGLLDILDEYFVSSTNGETEQEKHSTAYRLLVSLVEDLYDLNGTASDIDIDELDNLFEEAMMEQYGYRYIVEPPSGESRTFNTAEEAAEFIESNQSTAIHEDILYDMEELGCDDTMLICGHFVTTARNW